jgi:hypothetical protein
MSHTNADNKYKEVHAYFTVNAIASLVKRCKLAVLLPVFSVRKRPTILFVRINHQASIHCTLDMLPRIQYLTRNVGGKQALQQADESKNLALTSTTPSAFFELDGIECGKGTKVSVMFDNDQWHTGILDAYNTRTTKVRIIFPDPKIGIDLVTWVIRYLHCMVLT